MSKEKEKLKISEQTFVFDNYANEILMLGIEIKEDEIKKADINRYFFIFSNDLLDIYTDTWKYKDLHCRFSYDKWEIEHVGWQNIIKIHLTENNMLKAHLVCRRYPKEVFYNLLKDYYNVEGEYIIKSEE